MSTLFCTKHDSRVHEPTTHAWQVLGRHGLRTTMLVACALLAAGCITRAFATANTPAAFDFILAGTCIISASTPFIFGATTELAATWFAGLAKTRARP